MTVLETISRQQHSNQDCFCSLRVRMWSDYWLVPFDNHPAMNGCVRTFVVLVSVSPRVLLPVWVTTHLCGGQAFAALIADKLADQICGLFWYIG